MRGGRPGAVLGGAGAGGAVRILKAAAVVFTFLAVASVLPTADGGKCAFTQVREDENTLFWVPSDLLMGSYSLGK